MQKNKVIFSAAKESFIVRVLMDKVRGLGGEAEYVSTSLFNPDIEKNEGFLFVLYLEDGMRPSDDTIRQLSGWLVDQNARMILIGETQELEYMQDRIPNGLIYVSFTRPVDNTAFLSSVEEYFDKVKDGSLQKKILIVDDDPQYLSLIREWLKDVYKVSAANSGMQAIRFLGMNKVDLILLDYEMPVTSGPQVLEMLRSDPETASIPVIFLTGKGDKQSVMAVLELKPEGYFLKSIQREELLEKLQDFFVLRKSMT